MTTANRELRATLVSEYRPVSHSRKLPLSMANSWLWTWMNYQLFDHLENVVQLLCSYCQMHVIDCHAPFIFTQPSGQRFTTSRHHGRSRGNEGNIYSGLYFISSVSNQRTAGNTATIHLGTIRSRQISLFWTRSLSFEPERIFLFWLMNAV